MSVSRPRLRACGRLSRSPEARLGIDWHWWTLAGGCMAPARFSTPDHRRPCRSAALLGHGAAHLVVIPWCPPRCGRACFSLWQVVALEQHLRQAGGARPPLLPPWQARPLMSVRVTPPRSRRHPDRWGGVVPRLSTPHYALFGGLEEPGARHRLMRGAALPGYAGILKTVCVRP